ncbi:MAG TPA: hypothetical protein PKH97_02365, partial [Tetrasphaera sp.]|uniref:hypothetical protein n=1 Tax=Nostocoides sp. TaxID=1917966 RepID=UPI002C115337
RRTTPRVATTVGSALGLLLVTALTSMTWPQRLALAGAVLVAGLAYVLWRNRAEILAAADGSAAPPADLAPPTDIAPPPDPAPPTVTPQT